MNKLINAIKSHANVLDSRRGDGRYGTVTSVDPARSMARVSLQPEGVLTGWLPVLSLWAGNGWGVVCPPSPGDQVFIIPQESDAEHGVIVGSAYSAKRLPPKVPLGELWMVHKSGSSIILQNDGTIRLRGDLHVQGEIFDRIGSMSDIRAVHNQHTHTDSRGGGTSLPLVKD